MCTYYWFKRNSMNHKTLYTYNKTYGIVDASHKTCFSKFNSFTCTVSKAFTHDHVIYKWKSIIAPYVNVTKSTYIFCKVNINSRKLVM